MIPQAVPGYLLARCHFCDYHEAIRDDAVVLDVGANILPTGLDVLLALGEEMDVFLVVVVGIYCNVGDGIEIEWCCLSYPNVLEHFPEFRKGRYLDL